MSSIRIPVMKIKYYKRWNRRSSPWVWKTSSTESSVNDRSWYVVRNTPGVTGFVGSATKPIPLEPKEVERILGKQEVESKPKTHISVEVGEEVRITEGPFENCIAVVTEVNEEKGTVKGLVNMFGRETPVEVDYSQIEKGLE